MPQFRDDLLQEEGVKGAAWAASVCAEQQELGGKAESYLPLSFTIFL